MIQKFFVFFLLNIPPLLYGGELVGPPFPEIDYVADQEGIVVSIKLEAQRPKPPIDSGKEVTEVPKGPVVSKDHDTLVNEKFDLCCRQAGITCLSKNLREE
jgi:hypothetical protein